MITRRALWSWMVPGAGDEAAPNPPQPPDPRLTGTVAPPLARDRIAWLDARREAVDLSAGPRVATVSPFACLNAGADFCATCVERCPEPGAVRLDGRRVLVDPDRCTGCGVCVPLCPAPGGAILLRPVA